MIVVLSDGWATDEPDQVDAQMARLRRLAYRIVWINPPKASADYRPLVGGMAAALPYCDAFIGGTATRRWPKRPPPFAATGHHQTGYSRPDTFSREAGEKAMQLESTFSVVARIGTVWDTLMDFDRVAGCLPGAGVLAKLSDDAYKVGMKVKLGPVTLQYKGQLNVIERNAAERRAVLQGQAQVTGPRDSAGHRHPRPVRNRRQPRQARSARIWPSRGRPPPWARALSALSPTR